MNQHLSFFYMLHYLFLIYMSMALNWSNKKNLDLNPKFLTAFLYPILRLLVVSWSCLEIFRNLEEFNLATLSLRKFHCSLSILIPYKLPCSKKALLLAKQYLSDIVGNHLYRRFKMGVPQKERNECKYVVLQCKFWQFIVYFISLLSIDIGIHIDFTF